MFGRKQQQSLEGAGTAVQTTGTVNYTVINQGLSREEARSLFLDLFRDNLLELKGMAQKTALDRGAEITEKFLSKLADEHPEGLKAAQTPDFQDALFTVQKEHAKAGDDDLADLLVDLLVDRTKQDNRNLMQIVLNESLHTAPKLTASQISLLSILFFFKNVRNRSANTIGELGQYFERHIGPIVENIAIGEANFAHLQFTACGATSLGQITLEEIFVRTYPGLFNRGFDEARLDVIQIAPAHRENLIITCLNDATKLQFAALNMDVLEQKLSEIAIVEPQAQLIKNLFAEGSLDHQEVRSKVLAAAPSLESLLDKWGASTLKNFNLTSVGMAIGHANIKRYAGEFAPLSIWIN